MDVAGWNIQCRECILGKQPPKAGEKAPDRLAASWHFDYHEEHYGTTYDGLQPMLDFKASWYLSDHLEPGHAATLVVSAATFGVGLTVAATLTALIVLRTGARLPPLDGGAAGYVGAVAPA